MQARRTTNCACCKCRNQCWCYYLASLCTKWCPCCVCYDDCNNGDKGYENINAEKCVIDQQPSSSKQNSFKNKVRQENPLLDFKDDIIDENTIKHRFKHNTNDRFQKLMSKAIAFTHNTEQNGKRELLKNSTLNIYENDNFYRQTSGNGKNIIVVNFEKGEAVVVPIEFK